MMTESRNTHEECWLLLPWLANGRLAAAERAAVEGHLRGCSACTTELQRQQLIHGALTEPERVTYAPGPSLRKLMERIDGAAPAPHRSERAAVVRAHRMPAMLAATWRPPGLAWAATFVFALGVGILAPTFYRWSQPAYSTYTSAARPQAAVLHIAFERSLTVGEVEELLHSSGARIIEGPGTSGIFGVAPVGAPAVRAGEVSAQMRARAARLGSDARVRWIEPLPQDQASERAPGHPATEP
jgi:hypothetical protein